VSFVVRSENDLLCELLPLLGFDASGDSNLAAGPRMETFGDSRAGEGEFDEVEDDDEAVVVDTDEVDEVDLVEFDGDESEGEVEEERFGLPVL